jgi:acid phosphatase
VRSKGRGLGPGVGAAGIALAACALLACGTRSGPAPAPAAPVHESTNAILWIQTAAEYRAASLQAFRSATVHLERALEDARWTAAPEQTGDYGTLPPAIVLDMDEAVIRSDRYQGWLVKDGRRYSLETWNDWVRTETSEAMPGALPYVRRAVELGVHVFYVTNRTVEVEAASLATLRKLGFPVADGADDLLTQHERPEWGADKSTRRAEICKTHRILQIVGDNLNDFTSGAHTTVAERAALAERYGGYWGSRWIVMPNPSYGGWEGALHDHRWDLPREEILRRKHERIRSWR